ELKERERAEQRYEEAKRQGRQAALLTRESPDVFTLQVAGIVPDQDVVVETDYVQLARAEGAGWSLRIPLTTSPRYVRSPPLPPPPHAPLARTAGAPPRALLRPPGPPSPPAAPGAGGGGVEAPPPPLSLTSEEEQVPARLQDGSAVPDRDCVLVWRPPQQP